MPHNLEKIAAIISSKDFSKLIGLKEGLHFDAKDKDAYNINRHADKYEIAKDVSAFANAEGGYVIIGLKTKALIEENTEKVEKLQLFKQEDFPSDSWLDIITSFIHPQINNLKIGWVEDINNSNLGLIYIYIPKQDDEKKYFLIKNVSEEGNYLKRIVFGLAIREKSVTTIKTVKQIYQMIKQGKRPLEDKLTRIENKLDLIIDSDTSIIPEGYPLDKIEERIHEIEK